MHTVEALKAGFASAPLGKAVILRRGTSTPVLYYLDFEGLSPVAAGTDVVLDADGAAEVYTHEFCDVEVYDVDDVLVGRYTSAADGAVVEVRSQSLTGTNHTSGKVAAGEPVSLADAFDKLYTSFGATDFKVMFDGSAQYVQNVLRNLEGLYYNVVAYGAIGDGVQDDATAIGLAIDAAVAAGGGTVYFPAGTYLVGSQVTFPAKVNVLGAGADASIVTSSYLAGDAFIWESDARSEYCCYIQLRCEPDAETTFDHSVLWSATADTEGGLFIGVHFNGTECTIDAVVLADYGGFTFINCVFTTAGSVRLLRSDYGVLCQSCRFTVGAEYDGTIMAYSSGVFQNCQFDALAMTEAEDEFTYIKVGNDGELLSVTGCEFWHSNGVATVFHLGDLSSGANRIFEAGNSIPTKEDVTVYDATTWAVPEFRDENSVFLAHRIGRTETLEFEEYEGSTVIIPKPHEFGAGVIECDGDPAGVTVRMGLTNAPTGSVYTLCLWNSSSSNLTVTVDGLGWHGSVVSGSERWLQFILRPGRSYVTMTVVLDQDDLGTFASWRLTASNLNEVEIEEGRKQAGAYEVEAGDSTHQLMMKDGAKIVHIQNASPDVEFTADSDSALLIDPGTVFDLAVSAEHESLWLQFVSFNTDHFRTNGGKYTLLRGTTAMFHFVYGLDEKDGSGNYKWFLTGVSGLLAEQREANRGLYSGETNRLGGTSDEQVIEITAPVMLQSNLIEVDWAPTGTPGYLAIRLQSMNESAELPGPYAIADLPTDLTTRFVITVAEAVGVEAVYIQAPTTEGTGWQIIWSDSVSNINVLASGGVAVVDVSLVPGFGNSGALEWSAMKRNYPTV